MFYVGRQLLGFNALRGPSQRRADARQKLDVVDACGKLLLFHFAHDKKHFACLVARRATAHARDRGVSGGSAGAACNKDKGQAVALRPEPLPAMARIAGSSTPSPHCGRSPQHVRWSVLPLSTSPLWGRLSRRQHPGPRAMYRGSGSAEPFWRHKGVRPARRRGVDRGFFHIPRFCGTSIGRNSTPDLCTGCG